MCAAAAAAAAAAAVVNVIVAFGPKEGKKLQTFPNYFLGGLVVIFLWSSFSIMFVICTRDSALTKYNCHVYSVSSCNFHSKTS